MSIFKMADLSHLGFYGYNNGCFKKPNYNLLNCLVFEKIAVFACWRKDPKWRISAMLGFRGPVMRSLKSPCTTSYRSSVETIALKCLVFEKIALFCILATDKQTDKQTDGQLRCTKPLSLSRLNNRGKLHQRTNSYNLCTSVSENQRYIWCCTPCMSHSTVIVRVF